MTLEELSAGTNFIGVFLIDLVFDSVSAQLIELMGRDLNKIGDGGLG